jgi:hypothetical protein
MRSDTLFAAYTSSEFVHAAGVRLEAGESEGANGDPVAKARETFDRKALK